eukprot:gnl/TRDRNA2_/TRDRNA2_151487_c0_seq1.p1 gnl/TRDRNA2_/TRDRNA2_151487_c0~~gnl/TRDRNA2_/TRDRNA2_151487_c0_seq1.p1  ORF type:complete len:207 (+),score=46.99 gnl/TRDRNA2_/TRDRNA2_151487_c0_seq1:109-729(+)
MSYSMCSPITNSSFSSMDIALSKAKAGPVDTFDDLAPTAPPSPTITVVSLASPSWSSGESCDETDSLLLDSDDESVSDGFSTVVARSSCEDKIVDNQCPMRMVDNERRWTSLCIAVANVFFVAGMESEDEHPADYEDTYNQEQWDRVGKKLAGVFSNAQNEVSAEPDDFYSEEDWCKVGERLAGVFAESSAESLFDADEDSDDSVF